MTTLYGREALDVLISSTPDFEHIPDGKQEKHNHVDCDAGEDTKQRLYVKHVDGAILFHCHHCGTSGYYRPRERYSPIAEEVNRMVGLVPKPKTTSYDELTAKEEFDSFRIEGQLWLNQYGFDAQMCEDYGIKESVSGLILPVYKKNILGLTDVAGYQIRRYNGLPKYTTYTDQNYSYLSSALSLSVIITEDLLSSYKLHAAGYSTVCLLGTSLSPEMCTWMAQTYPRQVLWLDDDKGGHHGALKIIKEFSVLMPELTAIFQKQPKEIDMDELKQLEL
jgi:hypothetical protein